jgi:hypothetical protein
MWFQIRHDRLDQPKSAILAGKMRTIWEGNFPVTIHEVKSIFRVVVSPVANYPSNLQEVIMRRGSRKVPIEGLQGDFSIPLQAQCVLSVSYIQLILIFSHQGGKK